MLHKNLYVTGLKLGKRDRFGIWSQAESLALEMLARAIDAAFSKPNEKLKTLQMLRIQTETEKHLLRSCHEIGTIDERTYVRHEAELQAISKEVNGWITYVTQKGLNSPFVTDTSTRTP